METTRPFRQGELLARREIGKEIVRATETYALNRPLESYNAPNRAVFRRFLSFARTYRKARRLGFTFIDAMRAARVNSRGSGW